MHEQSQEPSGSTGPDVQAFEAAWTDPEPTESVRAAHIAIDADGFGRVSVNSDDLSNAIQGVFLSCRVGKLPRLILDLTIAETIDAVAEAEVAIPAATRDALVALGWTPPTARGGTVPSDLDVLDPPEGGRDHQAEAVATDA